MKNPFKYIIICGASVSSIFSLLCLYFVLQFYNNPNGIKTLHIINELGLCAERSLVLSVVIAVGTVAYSYMKKKKDLPR